MPARAIRVLALLAALLGPVSGCHGLPPAPSSDPMHPDRDEYDGWLYKKLTGQEQASQSRQADPNVRQASAQSEADESVLPGDPLAPGGVAPGAGVKHSAPAPKVVSSKNVKETKEDEEGGLGLEALAPENVYKKVKSAVGYGPNEDVARDAYREGLTLFEQKKYDEAAKKFATAADRWPDSALEEDALFMQGESYFFADRYPNAREAYETLLKKHEYSRYLDRAVAREFAIGRYWDKLDEKDHHWALTPNFTDKRRPWFDTRGNAVKAFEQARLNDPTGPLADDALMAAGNAHFLRGSFEEASCQYDTLWKEYPKSEHQLKAGLLAMESKQQIYQGEMYDGGPLKDAGQYADQILMRFGNELGSERDRVIEAKNRVVELQARQELAIGRFYDNKERYGSARIYYKAVIDKFPQTSAAQEAQTRLEEIKDYPADPTDYFKWMERIFGSKKRY